MAYRAQKFSTEASNVLPGAKTAAAIAVGELVYMDTAGLWALADAVGLEDTTRMDALGVMPKAALINEFVSPVKVIEVGAYSGLTIGAKQYLSGTPGGVTEVEPTVTVRQTVGFAISATKIRFEVGGASGVGGNGGDVGGDANVDSLTSISTIVAGTNLSTVAGTITGASNNASALAVGRLGATTPVLKVDASTSVQVTGIQVKGAAAAAGVDISAIGGGTNENLTINAKGSGTITLNPTATGAVNIGSSLGLTGALTVTSNAAGALSVGANGATNPALQVNAATGSVATGVKVTGAAAAGGVAVAAISSGTNENLTIDAKGSGTVTINGTATGEVTLGAATNVTGALGVTGAATVTSAGASALAVGANGATNPVVQVDGSTGSVATGVKVTGAAAAGGVAVAAISSGTNENLTIDAKGSGTVTINGTATGTVAMGADLTMADAKNIATNTGTGTKIGTATGQKIGFWNATPVVQQAHIADPSAMAGITQDALTDSTGGAADTTLAANSAISIFTIPIPDMTKLANGEVVTEITPGFAGTILKSFWVQEDPITTGSKAATLNMEIETTNVADGTLALTSALCTPIGKVIENVTPPSADNVFTAAEKISVEASAVTAFSEGSGSMVIVVSNDAVDDNFADVAAQLAKVKVDIAAAKTAVDLNNAAIDSLNALCASLGITAAA